MFITKKRRTLTSAPKIDFKRNASILHMTELKLEGVSKNNDGGDVTDKMKFCQTSP